MTLPLALRLISSDMVNLKHAAIAGHGIVALPGYVCRTDLHLRSSASALIAVIALAAGCRAPKGAGETRAERVNGVVETAIGDDAYVLRCKLGAFRSQAAAVERVYQRAGELCPGGFQVLDSADGSRLTYVRTVHGVQQVRRPDVAIVVQCHAPRTAD
ncbi:MAG: hypothetical protein E6J90_04280 [Deltaproteobacteria bacterium]|nr:MAG: hypothetical protein E6J90_04280 [Deltaproteobacteria bacterium]